MQVLASPSAAGAPFDQILIVTAFTTVVYGAVGWIVLRERTNHSTLVGRLAGRTGDLLGLPRWFALPQLLILAGIVSGVVGLYWDVSYHLANGRDAGPLANPSHYLIFLGLVTIFAGAVLGAGLASEDLPRRTLRIGRTWRSPYGPLVSMAVAMIALLGFPLDDLWHRLFGQDVTEWGPTHVLMIGGTVLAGLGMLLACAEVRQLDPEPNLVRDQLAGIGVLIFLCGPAAFMLEFAYGVPQFPLLNDPLLQSLAAGLAFVYAAFRGVRAVAVLWVAYVAVQFALAGLNVGVFDALFPWPASFAGGALVGVVLTRIKRKSLAFGALGGAATAAGTIGVEYFWTNAERPTLWPVAMLPQALLYGVLVGAGAGVVAVWLRVRLDDVAGVDTSEAHRTPRVSWGVAAAVGMAVVIGVFAFNVPPRHDAQVSANVTVFDRTGGAHDSARLRVEVFPHDAADDAWWFQALSWQGGDAIHADLREASPGVYETDRRVPAYADWKTLVRLHLPSHTLVAAPVYLPADDAIPVSAYRLASGPRDFVQESKILRRETKPGVPAGLAGASYALVGALFLALFGIIGAGVTAAARRPVVTTTHQLMGAGR